MQGMSAQGPLQWVPVLFWMSVDIIFSVIRDRRFFFAVKVIHVL